MKNLLKDNWPFLLILLAGWLLILTGCSTVHKSSTSTQKKVDSSSVTVIDSVHVKKYDTSTVTHEISEYQTKTIELFDTVWVTKDSVTTVLRTRTIWANGSQSKEVTKTGTGADSLSFFQRIESKLSKEEKAKIVIKDKTGFNWWKIIPWVLVILFLGVLFIAGKWAIKKFL